ncbi:MAG: phosphate propanoyltransferase [Steroidobacteraceae bacterium]
MDLMLTGMDEHTDDLRIPIAISARHAHLCQTTLDALFGPGYQLAPRNSLKQVGQYAAQEMIALVGPHGRIDHVRVLGPARGEDQIEISRTDEVTLGLAAPLRVSGDLRNTPGVTLEGPRGPVSLTGGLVCALRHIHMSPADAVRLGVHDHEVVQVAVDGPRQVVFGNVVVRVGEAFRLELHLDTDEGNAAGVEPGTTARIIRSL